jgi:hypothetical protein
MIWTRIFSSVYIWWLFLFELNGTWNNNTRSLRSVESTATHSVFLRKEEEDIAICAPMSSSQPLLHYQPIDPIIMVKEEVDGWGFREQYPLTKEMMMAGLIGSGTGSSHFSNMFPNGYKLLFDKINCKDAEIHVAIFGGSMTAGENCFVKSMPSVRYPNCAWQFRVLEWLSRAYPHVKFVHHNFAVSSSTSAYSFSAFRDMLAEGGVRPDLCIFDNSINDESIIVLKGTTNVNSIYENIVRLAIANDVALLVMSVFLGKTHDELFSIESVYESVCRPYGIPLVSYRLAVLDNVTHAESLRSFDPAYHIRDTLLSIFWGLHSGDYHPPFQGHRGVADHVIYFLYHAHKHYEAAWKNLKDAELKSPLEKLRAMDPLFGALRYDTKEGSENDDDSPTDAGLECTPVSVRLSSLEAEQAKVSGPFIPLWNTGWVFKSDKPGKPAGWIYESSNRTAEQLATIGSLNDGHGASLYEGLIVFPAMVVHGRVTVTYLESYNNCGDFEIWIGEPRRDNHHNAEIGNFHVTESWKAERHPNMVQCCDQRGHGDTRRATISTYRHNMTFSAVVQQTVHFDISGSYAVHIQALPLSADEYASRKGDKVKILGITVC